VFLKFYSLSDAQEIRHLLWETRFHCCVFSIPVLRTLFSGRSLSILSCSLPLEFPSRRCTNLLQHIARANKFLWWLLMFGGGEGGDLSMELVSCHPFGDYNFEVAPRFFWKISAPLSQTAHFPQVFRLKLLAII